MNHDCVHDPEPIETFSGTHEFHPTVLSDTDAVNEGNADEIVWDIEHGRCPRCGDPLPTGFPAGSRITRCRTIPICYRCGDDEAHQVMDAMKGIGWGISGAGWWPIPVEEIEERRAWIMAQMKPAILDVASGTVISEDSVGQVINPCNTGGWAQYGFAEEEQQS